ncbi:alpha/beta hydrolase family protein [Rhizorhabdus dicambivorans]|uniref:Palmitoyl-protein thioesterase ABHD10, mitochondrial n=1 Tax=Rhizorhabdus dicambivorans TaxID=1850238 RepID=A0A2A4G1H0_9SPHN|nr:alpha/beta hydrolase [Rhizorhabdus dicambivorans]ATE63355.1 alpha/beta hydrolase [Rhizorhabdus dicambivorans]PCE43570.1 alpha/beta hydrolase [Rhizorhabdus dicambivorans]
MTALLTRPDKPALAYRYRPGRAPTIVFFPGYMSDMEGEKATALDAWAGREGRAMLRFDYAGCGASEGRFADFTLADWRDDALDMIAAFAAQGPLVLVGSSMGGWLALLVALALPERCHALVGIAAAPDFTEWGFTEDQIELLREEARIERPTPYDDEPYVTTLAFWESGQANLLLAKGEKGEIALDMPVRLLQGQLDETVPVSIALRLGRALRSADVQTILVKDGDHRLSRPGDIALLIATVAQLMEP